MDLKKISATVVTGFLGSGKTTLLAELLRNTQHKRMALVVNEFGALDIDADVLRRCASENCDAAANVVQNDSGNCVYELANGCICCTVQEEFYPVLRELIARRDTLDHILIETSGLALPKPLVQAFQWPDIRAYCTVDAVVTVVDAEAVRDGRYVSDVAAMQQQMQADPNIEHDRSVQELFEDQLSVSDLVILNKTDLVDAQQLAEVEQTVSGHLSRAVKLVHATHGRVDADVLLGVGAASEDQMETRITHHDLHHSHSEEHEHAHDQFDSLIIHLGRVDDARLQAAIKQLMTEQEIYRIKGFVAIAEKPMRQIVQVVGTRMQQYFDRPWEDGEQPATRLVVIGKHLDQGQVEGVLRAALTT